MKLILCFLLGLQVLVCIIEMVEASSTRYANYTKRVFVVKTDDGTPFKETRKTKEFMEFVDNDPIISTHIMKLPILKLERIHPDELYVIQLVEPLKKGHFYKLRMKFAGSLAVKKREGIWADTYIDKNSTEKRYFVATQMRYGNARRVFPCFDEPSIKAPFEISIAHLKNMTALTTMTVKHTEPSLNDPSWVWDTFKRSAPMATFTLGFVISDFTRYTPPITLQPPCFDIICMLTNVHGRKDLVPSFTKTHTEAPNAIKALEQFFSMTFPVPKLDIVAVPGYTAIPESAWGIIICKESDVISDDFVNQQLSKEVTQQFIGDLVTPLTWEDSVMNKALVNFVADMIQPTYDKSFVYTGNLWTKYYPLYYEYGQNKPYSKQVDKMDFLEVTKTELILRMFNYTLSTNTFGGAVRRLVKSRMFQSFSTEDVWDSLSEEAFADGTLPESATCSQVAKSWISKDRIPMLKVTRDYKGSQVEIEQSTFTRELIDEREPAEEPLAWWVPIVITTEDNLDFEDTRPYIWMKEEPRIVLEYVTDKKSFILVNPEEIAPAIVNYDRQNWELLSKSLKNHPNKILPFTRAKLVHDALNLAYAGHLRFDVALDVISFLKHENNPIVWQPAFNMFDHILRRLEGTEAADKFQQYIKKTVTPIFKKIQASLHISKDDERTYKSAQAALCNAGYEPCVVEARTEWAKWMQSAEPDAGVPIHQIHFCWVFKWGDRDEWEFGFARYFNYASHMKQSDRLYLLKTLVSCPKDAWKIERVLNMTMLNAHSNISEANTRFILNVLSNEVGYTALFNLVADNWDALKEKYDTGENGLWSSIVSAATRNFKTQDGLDMVTELYVERQGELGFADLAMEQSLNQIRRQLKWTDYSLPLIDKWLTNYLTVQPQTTITKV